jgi:hypothetical protein
MTGTGVIAQGKKAVDAGRVLAKSQGALNAAAEGATRLKSRVARALTRQLNEALKEMGKATGTGAAAGIGKSIVGDLLKSNIGEPNGGAENNSVPDADRSIPQRIPGDITPNL